MSVSSVGPNFRTNGNTGIVPNNGSIEKNLKLIDNTLQEIKDVVAQYKAHVASLENSFSSSSTSSPSTSGSSSKGNCGCFPSEFPSSDSINRPKDTLKVDDKGVITTPGGYKIEQLGQFEWKVSGPDGKSTRVWGDPHVDEGDGGKWDFKNNSTFVLGDGTEIHVSTKPYGNGMTVTGQLDITNGHDHVQVTDIDKGKGVVSGIAKDGYETAVDFRAKNEDRFTMGKETDDWSLLGREVIGDVNGGEKFKVGNFMFPGQEAIQGTAQTGDAAIRNAGKSEGGAPAKLDPAKTKPSTQADRRDELIKKLHDAIDKLFGQLKNTQCRGFNPFRMKDDFGKYHREDHKRGINDSFRDIRKMYRALDQVSRLNDMLQKRSVFF